MTIEVVTVRLSSSPPRHSKLPHSHLGWPRKCLPTLTPNGILGAKKTGQPGLMDGAESDHCQAPTASPATLMARRRRTSRVPVTTLGRTHQVKSESKWSLEDVGDGKIDRAGLSRMPMLGIQKSVESDPTFENRHQISSVHDDHQCALL